MSKVVAFVPLRGGSQSIPLKNIKNFCGKPLCFWVLKELEESVVDEIYVATDSEQIKNTVISFNFAKVKVYDRDKENATNTASTESVMLEFLSKKQFSKDCLFILVQATSPFTKAQHINEALLKKKADKADSLLSVVLTKRFFWQFNLEPLNYDYKKRPRRQDFQGMFMENGAFYISTVGGILESKNRLHGKISLYEMPEYSGYEIDEDIDWIICEKLMEHHNKI